MTIEEYEKFLESLSLEQLIEIIDLAEIEYIKKVIFKRSAKLLDNFLGAKQYVFHNRTKIGTQDIAKMFYTQLNAYIKQNKKQLLVDCRSGTTCVMSKIDKVLMEILSKSYALVALNSNETTK